jgi:capsular exopolysaccharide synthesis family protein
MTLIVTSVVTIETFRMKSIYQASATIEVGKETRTLRAGELVIQTDDSDDLYYVRLGMKTKIRMLMSRPVLEEVAVRLKLDQNPNFMDVIERRSMWEAIKAIANGSSSRSTPIAASDSGTPPTGELPQEESARLAPCVSVLASNLSAEPIEDTRMLSISFRHTDPALAAAVVNTVAKVFIQRNFENKTEQFAQTSEWLEARTRELKANVEKAEQELANYTRDHNIFSLEGKETLTTEKLSRLHDQVTRAEIERKLKESLYEEVRLGRAPRLPEAFSDPRIVALQTKLGELETQAAQLDVKYGPDNPNLKQVKNQIAVIKDQIAESYKTLEEKLRADYERAVRDERSLRAAFERAKAEAVKQNQAAIQYSILKQQVETAKSLYQDFLQKTNQARIQVAEQHNNLRLIESAHVPTSPIGPDRTRTIMIGLMVSLVLGVGLCLFLEYLDNTIKTIEDVNRYAQLPALGVIPSISSRKRRSLQAAQPDPAKAIATLNSRSSVAEAYRVLRTSVLLSTAGGPPKIILITSSQPGEGKTTTAINTAISLAQLGASVLIIDADMRKPSAHKTFDVEHKVGLSSYLSGQAELDGLIRALPISNLWLLPCGPVPPNPAELISSQKMRQLLEQLAERYDHILIDSPPLMNVTDPVILSTMVDGVILVVHGGKSTREVLRRARQELEAVGAKIFGVVLNNIDLRREGYDEYYYYRYYSGYGKDGAGDGAD